MLLLLHYTHSLRCFEYQFKSVYVYNILYMYSCMLYTMSCYSKNSTFYYNTNMFLYCFLSISYYSKYIETSLKRASSTTLFPLNTTIRKTNSPLTIMRSRVLLSPKFLNISNFFSSCVFNAKNCTNDRK